MKFLFFFIFLFSISAMASARACNEFIGTCDFYLCQEQHFNCGPNGYNLGYGYKYCSLSNSNLLNQMKSIEGQQWVVDTFTCLQTKNYENSLDLANETNDKKICELIADTSYDSHPDCYIQAGFCQLSAYEKGLILNLIKQEAFSLRAILQGLKILKQCSLQD